MYKNNKNIRKELLKMKKEKQEGITLVALVVTIVLNSLRCGRKKECII